MADFHSRSCVLDIETIGSPSVAELMDPVKAPGHYKDPFKIQTYQIDKLAERIATASLEPDLCEVVALGFDNGRKLEAYTRAEMSESDMIELFWNVCGQDRFIGFNILKFDLPVLIRRSQLLGIPHAQVVLDRYRTSHVDLLERLSFNGLITYRSLSFYCRRFQIDCPDDPVEGHEIPGLVAEGDWAAVLAHCVADVQKTKLLAQRLGILQTVAV